MAAKQLPEIGFLRLKQIIGDKKSNVPPLIPISRSSFLNGVNSGKFPKPIKFGARSNGWRIEDILELIKSFGQ